VWIDFDRGSDSGPVVRLVNLIRDEVGIAVSEPILMEVLAGARDAQAWTDLRRLLTSFGWIRADASVDFEGAARLYQTCRASGVTPRGLNDCMIATIALRSGSPVLTADRDFAAMSQVVPLEIDRSFRSKSTVVLQPNAHRPQASYQQNSTMHAGYSGTIRPMFDNDVVAMADILLPQQHSRECALPNVRNYEHLC